MLAYLDGISPAITVNKILITTRIVPPSVGNVDTFLIPDKFLIIMFIGIFNKIVIVIPSNPEIKPMINVSALKTLEISFFLAPMALKIPISFVLSKTQIYVITPIIIEDTINDILTNAINT